MFKSVSLVFPILFLLTACSSPVADHGARKEGTPQGAEKKAAQVLWGKVVGISDGDTFKLLVEGNRTVRVRLYGVDAPEKGQDYGTQARGKLSELLFSKNIEVEQKDKDRYGRVVGVAVVDGTNVNEELLRSGLVWHYTADDRSEEWAALQRAAQKRKVGLWSQANPTPPWQWRKQKRAAQAVE